MPMTSTRSKLGSRRASLGMRESWSGAAIQADAQPSRRGDRVLHFDPHPADRRGLESVELAVADGSAARELPPGRSVSLRSQHGIARDALPARDVLLQTTEAH